MKYILSALLAIFVTVNPLVSHYAMGGAAHGDHVMGAESHHSLAEECISNCSDAPAENCCTVAVVHCAAPMACMTDGVRIDHVFSHKIDYPLSSDTVRRLSAETETPPPRI